MIHLYPRTQRNWFEKSYFNYRDTEQNLDETVSQCLMASSQSIDWLIDFNGMSANIGLFPTCIKLELSPLGWDLLRLAVLSDTRIRLAVSWFRWLWFEAVWHGFREAGIHVPHVETDAPWASEGHLPRLLVHRLAPEGNAGGVQGIFGTAGRVWATVLHLLLT